jgi:hypothetical protein
MSAYAVLGRRHLAARAYGRCCDGLKELGLEPSASLTQAYQATSHGTAYLGSTRSGEVVELTSKLPSSLSTLIDGEAKQAEMARRIGRGAW